MDISNLILSVNSAHYGQKDATKFKDITKLISRGKENSSSAKYAEVLPEISNTGEYSSDDIVGISINGGHNRVKFDKQEVDLAIKAKVRAFITDSEYHRNRSYNVGEREIYTYLMHSPYKPTNFQQGTVWTR